MGKYLVVAMAMTSLVGCKSAYERGFDDGYDQGFDTGYSETYTGAFNRGEQEGMASTEAYDQGFTDGYNTGNESGFAQGRADFASPEYEAGWSAGYNDSYGDAYAENFHPGEADGRIDGDQDGYNDGYNVGFDVAYDAAYVPAYNNGYSTGRSSGYSDGYSWGLVNGRSDGYNSGYSDGYDDGYDDGHYDAGNSTMSSNPIVSLASAVNRDLIDYKNLPKFQEQTLMDGGLGLSTGEDAVVDIEKLAALKEKHYLNAMSEQLQMRFGLNSDSAGHVALVVHQYNKLAGSRALTQADASAFSEELIGFDMKEIESGVKASVKGNSEMLNKIITHGSKKLGVSTDKFNQMISEIFF